MVRIQESPRELQDADNGDVQNSNRVNANGLDSAMHAKLSQSGVTMNQSDVDMKMISASSQLNKTAMRTGHQFGVRNDSLSSSLPMGLTSFNKKGSHGGTVLPAMPNQVIDRAKKNQDAMSLIGIKPLDLKLGKQPTLYMHTNIGGAQELHTPGNRTSVAQDS